jgi:hypothetical protein
MKSHIWTTDTAYVPGGTGIRQDRPTSAWRCLGSSGTLHSLDRHRRSSRSSCWCSQIWTAAAAVSGGLAPLLPSLAPPPTSTPIMTLMYTKLKNNRQLTNKI